MRKDRLIVGLLCIVFAVWTFLSDSTIDPAVAIGIFGLITVAIARKNDRLLSIAPFECDSHYQFFSYRY